MKEVFCIMSFLFMAVLVRGQDFNYVHYDTKDGLAGSTVYSECQDKDGFLWFATENGLSRFDGKTFRNFTVKDGLPDNEVLKVYVDSKNRIWISSFNKELCYYYEGTIFNKSNSALVKKIKLKETPNSFSESDMGILAIASPSTLTIISPKDEVVNFEASEICADCAQICVGPFFEKIVVSAGKRGELYVINSNNTFSYLRQIDKNELNPNDKNYMFPTRTDRSSLATSWLKLKSRMNSYEVVNGVSTYVNSNDGTWAIDTVKNQWSDHFLPGKKVSKTIKDSEGQLWFSTLGEGVYKLPSREIRTIQSAADQSKSNSEVFSIIKGNDVMIAGIGFSKVLLLSGGRCTSLIDYEDKKEFSRNIQQNNREYTAKKLSSGTVLLGFDAFLVKQPPFAAPVFNYIFPIKSIEEINADTVLVGTSSYVYKMDVKNLKITDTVWTGRCTKVFYARPKTYIGTTNGLYEVSEDKTYRYLGKIHNSLTRRITDIKSTADNTLLISTSDKGIVAFKNDRVIYTIEDVNGLSSNICKTLFLDQHYLWVGTNKGLNRINLAESNRPVTKFSISDGLPSDIINAVYVQDSLVWVGSPAGLTYFNPGKISENSISNLKLLNVNVDGAPQQSGSVYHLSYNGAISFEYVAISAKSGGDIVYHYKLGGLDNEWKETRLGNLNYQSLPSGDYELELYAINKFNVKSNSIRIRFSIATPFWKTWWFYLLSFLLIVLFTGLLVNRRYQKSRRALEEKSKVQQQFAALEQQAMQAQMNPHFIFNCLNSIQQYILTNDKQKANQYLTGFASLIRQTLDISGKKTITVAEEIRYLTNYLNMEKMRFGDNFSFTISIGTNVSTDFIEMPAMLLQPYVENALRHGIRYKTEGMGIVEIAFTLNNEVLCCEIKDNGVGRKRASELKSRQHIEYQSRGMNLTEKRIALLNLGRNKSITVQVTDLSNKDGNACGTQININIPL